MIKNRENEVISRYMKLLKNAYDLKTQIMKKEGVVTGECQTLYGFIFSALLLAGKTYKEERRDELDVLIIEDGEEKFSIPKGEIEEILPESYLQAEVEENPSEAPLLHPAEEILETGEDIIILEKTEHEKLDEEKVHENIEEMISSQPENKATVVEEQTKILRAEDTDEFLKKREHFIFNMHHIRVENANGFHPEFDVVIYPREYIAGKIPVGMVAAVIGNGRIRVAFTPEDAMKKSLEICFDDYTFLIMGRWSEMEFHTDVLNGDSSFQIVADEVVKTNSGMLPHYFGKHIQAANAEMEFYPIADHNNSSGVVTSFLLVRQEGKEDVIFPEITGLLNIPMEGKLLQIETYWSGIGYCIHTT